jgi:hypothetical protein
VHKTVATDVGHLVSTVAGLGLHDTDIESLYSSEIHACSHELLLLFLEDNSGARVKISDNLKEYCKPPTFDNIKRLYYTHILSYQRRIYAKGERRSLPQGLRNTTDGPAN